MFGERRQILAERDLIAGLRVRELDLPAAQRRHHFVAHGARGDVGRAFGEAVDVAAQLADLIGQLGAHRARRGVHHRPGQPVGAVAGDRCGGGLLQRLVGEQPARRVGQAGELGEGPAAQQGGFDQCGGVPGEAFADSGDVGESAGVGERQLSDLGEGGRPGVAGQVGDIGAGEAQEGFTPVIITA